MTEKYPFSVFQKVRCVEKTQESDEAKELELEISRELGQDLHERFEVNFQEDNEKIVEIRFTLQPTMEQKKREIQQMNENTFLSEKLLNIKDQDDVQRDQWIDDVVGGFFLEDQLDYSHIQDSSFVTRESGSLTKKLSSIEARPILWVVLYFIVLSHVFQLLMDQIFK